MEENRTRCGPYGFSFYFPAMPFDSLFASEILQEVVWTVAALVLIGLVASLSQRLVWRYVEEPSRRYRAVRLIRRTGSLIFILILIFIWSPGERNVLGFLTIVGAGLAIAMREALLSVVGWMSLTIRGYYRQGDRIEVNGVRGDVVDVRLMHSTMMEIGGWVDADQSTGRLVHIPNSWIYQHAIYNYTRGFSFIWNELKITVTFRSDWAAAREIMLTHAQESAAVVEQQATREIRQMAREYLIHYSILTPFVYVAITQDGVLLTLRYLCEARKRRGTMHSLSIGILDAFAKHGGIEVAPSFMGVTRFDLPQFGVTGEPGNPTKEDGLGTG